MHDEDDCNLSPGAEFFPAAFERRYLKRAERVVDDLEFNQLFVRYILNFLSDFKQLIDFRVRLIAEVFRLAELQDASQDERLKVSWCALSLVTDRYFAYRAVNYGWNIQEQMRMKLGWYRLISPLFIPNLQKERLALKDLSAWRSEFLALQSRDRGPLPGCNLCESKCQYHWDTSELLADTRIQFDFDEAINSSKEKPTTIAADHCYALSKKLSGQGSLDFAYCLAIHLVLNSCRGMDPSAPLSLMSTDAQDVISEEIRESLLSIA